MSDDQSPYQPPTAPNRNEPLVSAETTPRQDVQQGMKRLFIILLMIGLGLGAIVAVGVVALIHRLGLTDVPARRQDSDQSSVIERQPDLRHISEYSIESLQ